MRDGWPCHEDSLMLGVEDSVMRYIGLGLGACEWGGMLHDGMLFVGIGARSHEAERCISQQDLERCIASRIAMAYVVALVSGRNVLASGGVGRLEQRWRLDLGDAALKLGVISLEARPLLGVDHEAGEVFALGAVGAP